MIQSLASVTSALEKIAAVLSFRMLTFYNSRIAPAERPTNLDAPDLPTGIVWLDLLRPEPAEISFVERASGLHVPSKAELSEIESSSRLRSGDGALYLSAPLIYRAQSQLPLSTNTGCARQIL